MKKFVKLNLLQMRRNSVMWSLIKVNHGILKGLVNFREVFTFSHFIRFNKGPYFNYVSTFLTIFDQLSNLVSMFITVRKKLF